MYKSLSRRSIIENNQRLSIDSHLLCLDIKHDNTNNRSTHKKELQFSPRLASKAYSSRRIHHHHHQAIPEESELSTESATLSSSADEERHIEATIEYDQDLARQLQDASTDLKAIADGQMTQHEAELKSINHHHSHYHKHCQLHNHHTHLQPSGANQNSNSAKSLVNESPKGAAVSQHRPTCVHYQAAHEHHDEHPIRHHGHQQGQAKQLHHCVGCNTANRHANGHESSHHTHQLHQHHPLASTGRFGRQLQTAGGHINLRAHQSPQLATYLLVNCKRRAATTSGQQAADMATWSHAKRRVSMGSAEPHIAQPNVSTSSAALHSLAGGGCGNHLSDIHGGDTSARGPTADQRAPTNSASKFVSQLYFLMHLSAIISLLMHHKNLVSNERFRLLAGGPKSVAQPPVGMVSEANGDSIPPVALHLNGDHQPSMTQAKQQLSNNASVAQQHQQQPQYNGSHSRRFRSLWPQLQVAPGGPEASPGQASNQKSNSQNSSSDILICLFGYHHARRALQYFLSYLLVSSIAILICLWLTRVWPKSDTTATTATTTTTTSQPGHGSSADKSPMAATAGRNNRDCTPVLIGSISLGLIQLIVIGLEIASSFKSSVRLNSANNLFTDHHHRAVVADQVQESGQHQHQSPSANQRLAAIYLPILQFLFVSLLMQYILSRVARNRRFESNAAPDNRWWRPADGFGPPWTTTARLTQNLAPQQVLGDNNKSNRKRSRKTRDVQRNLELSRENNGADHLATGVKSVPLRSINESLQNIALAHLLVTHILLWLMRLNSISLIQSHQSLDELRLQQQQQQLLMLHHQQHSARHPGQWPPTPTSLAGDINQGPQSNQDSDANLRSPVGRSSFNQVASNGSGDQVNPLLVTKSNGPHYKIRPDEPRDHQLESLVPPVVGRDPPASPGGSTVLMRTPPLATLSSPPPPSSTTTEQVRVMPTGDNSKQIPSGPEIVDESSPVVSSGNQSASGRNSSELGRGLRSTLTSGIERSHGKPIHQTPPSTSNQTNHANHQLPHGGQEVPAPGSSTVPGDSRVPMGVDKPLGSDVTGHNATSGGAEVPNLVGNQHLVIGGAGGRGPSISRPTRLIDMPANSTRQSSAFPSLTNTDSSNPVDPGHQSSTTSTTLAPQSTRATQEATSTTLQPNGSASITLGHRNVSANLFRLSLPKRMTAFRQGRPSQRSAYPLVPPGTERDQVPQIRSPVSSVSTTPEPQRSSPPPPSTTTTTTTTTTKADLRQYASRHQQKLPPPLPPSFTEQSASASTTQAPEPTRTPANVDRGSTNSSPSHRVRVLISRDEEPTGAGLHDNDSDDRSIDDLKSVIRLGAASTTTRSEPDHDYLDSASNSGPVRDQPRPRGPLKVGGREGGPRPFPSVDQDPAREHSSGTRSVAVTSAKAAKKPANEPRLVGPPDLGAQGNEGSSEEETNYEEDDEESSGPAADDELQTTRPRDARHGSTGNDELESSVDLDLDSLLPPVPNYDELLHEEEPLSEDELLMARRKTPSTSDPTRDLGAGSPKPTSHSTEARHRESALGEFRKPRSEPLVMRPPTIPPYQPLDATSIGGHHYQHQHHQQPPSPTFADFLLPLVQQYHILILTILFNMWLDNMHKYKTLNGLMRAGRNDGKLMIASKRHHFGSNFLLLRPSQLDKSQASHGLHQSARALLLKQASRNTSQLLDSNVHQSVDSMSNSSSTNQLIAIPIGSSQAGSSPAGAIFDQSPTTTMDSSMTRSASLESLSTKSSIVEASASTFKRARHNHQSGDNKQSKLVAKVRGRSLLSGSQGSNQVLLEDAEFRGQPEQRNQQQAPSSVCGLFFGLLIISGSLIVILLGIDLVSLLSQCFTQLISILVCLFGLGLVWRLSKRFKASDTGRQLSDPLAAGALAKNSQHSDQANFFHYLFLLAAYYCGISGALNVGQQHDQSQLFSHQVVQFIQRQFNANESINIYPTLRHYSSTDPLEFRLQQQADQQDQLQPRQAHYRMTNYHDPSVFGPGQLHEPAPFAATPATVATATPTAINYQLLFHAALALKGLVLILQVTLQTILIRSTSASVHSVTGSQVSCSNRSPGNWNQLVRLELRQIYTFLMFANLSLWALEICDHQQQVATATANQITDWLVPMNAPDLATHLGPALMSAGSSQPPVGGSANYSHSSGQPAPYHQGQSLAGPANGSSSQPQGSKQQPAANEHQLLTMAGLSRFSGSVVTLSHLYHGLVFMQN